MNNLPELKDIHLPEKITSIPLGYGSVLFMFILVCLIVFWPYLMHLYLQTKKKYALRLLDSLNQSSTSSVCKISEVLRRICKIKYKDSVGLYGTKWADFLNRTSSKKLPPYLMTILINAPYAPAWNQLNEHDFKEIKNFATDWVRYNL